MTDEVVNLDVLEGLGQIPDQSIHCCVTSPPYWGLRDYGVEGQIGLEETPEKYVAKMVDVFREVRRALRDDGTLWLSLGDSYAGSGKGRNSDGTHREGGKQGTSRGTVNGLLAKTFCKGLKPKDLIGIPWRVAFALQSDGWYLRQDIIWHKPNPMPESVRDRCTKSHEYLFLMSKSSRYYYDQDAIRESFKTTEEHRQTATHVQGWATEGDHSAVAHAVPSSYKGSKFNHGKTAGHQPKSSDKPRHDSSNGRNKRSVWTIPTTAFPGSHFATFPPDLVKPCILAGCPDGGVVLDPFFGSGTVGIVAKDLGRHYIGIELNPEYAAMAKRRILCEADMTERLFTEVLS